ncbi:MAG: NUDIX domain-containing protein [Paenibacillus sp.]|uniref:8-oxo-dGTP pyrophosphatase MutT, NUDIX family n=2 Tax=Paenibacillus aquistagni TaxID=1852522 RepID=A0A1X7LCN0_9BACL|nr:NUDIX hydrolase [Paenibacillus aquistagni]MBR2568768.1 NUDIX domain-containing protein [Paenibacillus sp.]NMM53088.1 NUDIX domain-containing protein [Paenibacillus aquistagni]SMG50929.1 8-oxo-dGTP pyrophosphatase MutT, NUDIX family [Paenibacillus aquistagni]
MRLLSKWIHPATPQTYSRVYERKAARAIVLDGSQILLLYTKRYNDYSFPGGGIDPDEEVMEGLKRELTEETGARNINVISEYGYIDEYRPHYKPEYDVIHMLSYFYICEIDRELGDAQMEDYETSNGMSAVWVDLQQAIAHNRQVMNAKEASMGLSIERETYVLELVAKELLDQAG